MIYSRSGSGYEFLRVLDPDPGKSFGCGSDLIYFRHDRKFKKINQLLSLLKEYSTIFSVHLKQKRSKFLLVIFFSSFLPGSESETNNSGSGYRKKFPDATGSGFTTLACRVHKQG